MEDKKDISIDELALMIKDGFDKLEDGQQKLEDGQQKVERRMEKLEDGQQKMERRLEKLEAGQQRIEMHLMNVVHRSEFEKLKEQVQILQNKVGISQK